MWQFQVNILEHCYFKETFTWIDYRVWHIRSISFLLEIPSAGVKPCPCNLSYKKSGVYSSILFWIKEKVPLRSSQSGLSSVSGRSCVSFHFCGCNVHGIDVHVKFCTYITMQGLHTTHLHCQNFLEKSSITHFANLQVNEMSAISVFPIGS